jgi:hypothetical protein
VKASIIHVNSFTGLGIRIMVRLLDLTSLASKGSPLSLEGSSLMCYLKNEFTFMIMVIGWVKGQTHHGSRA